MRRGALIGLAMMAALAMVTTTQTQTFTGTLKKVNDTGTLTIGSARTRCPSPTPAPGKPAGYSIDPAWRSPSQSSRSSSDRTSRSVGSP